MAVRVKVRIRANGKSKVLTVLVNGGAESEEPVIAIKPADADDFRACRSRTCFRYYT